MFRASSAHLQEDTVVYMQQTGPGAHPASCTMGTGVKRPGRGVNLPPPSSADVKERVELYLFSPSGPSWPVKR